MHSTDEQPPINSSTALPAPPPKPDPRYGMRFRKNFDTGVVTPIGIVKLNNSVGRNDPCPCGSGKKFKHCHLKGA